MSTTRRAEWVVQQQSCVGGLWRDLLVVHDEEAAFRSLCSNRDHNPHLRFRLVKRETTERVVSA